MYDLFSSYDATEVIKKWKVRSYRLLSYIMFGIFGFLVLQFLIIMFFLNEEFIIIYGLLLFSLFFVVIALGSIQRSHRITSGQKTILEVELFNNYPTDQTKIPIVKLASNNKYNSEVAVMLLLGTHVIEIIRLNKGLKKTASYQTKHTVFKFYIDTRKGQEKTQRKFFIESQRMLHKFYMMHDTEFKIMKHIMANGYHYEIYENNILTKQFR
jgi:hypothetical protein